jgi:hypothetical protein
MCADATLHFEVELISIGDTPPPVNVFKEIDQNKDKMLSREEVSKMVIYLFCLIYSSLWR